MTTPHSPLSIEDEFDVDPSYLNLNSGTLGVCPRTVVDAVCRETREFERNPTQSLFGAWERVWRVQKQCAEFFGARPADIFLRPSVTDVLNDLILGLRVERGTEILTSDLEYGAISNICKFHAQGSGAELRTFVLPKTAAEMKSLRAGDLVERVVGAIGPKTRVVLLSHVVTGNGTVMPVREIASETRRRGVLLIVDGAHAPGALPLDFSELADVDFYGGNLHKWIMGPKGTAFGWVPERNHELLKSRTAGWTTFETGGAFEGFGGGDRFAGRMLASASNMFGPFFALEETFAFWKKWGPDAVRARLSEKQELWIREFAERGPGWECLSPLASELRGPLVSYELPDELARLGYGAMKKIFEQTRVQVSTPLVGGRSVLRIAMGVSVREGRLREGVQALSSGLKSIS